MASQRKGCFSDSRDAPQGLGGGDDGDAVEGDQAAIIKPTFFK